MSEWTVIIINSVTLFLIAETICVTICIIEHDDICLMDWINMCLGIPVFVVMICIGCSIAKINSDSLSVISIAVALIALQFARSPSR